jgi:hypothetical protein
MDTSQTRLIELLREVHLQAFKEIERLNLRIAELEMPARQPVQQPVIKTTMHGPLDIQKESGAAVLNEVTLAGPIASWVDKEIVVALEKGDGTRATRSRWIIFTAFTATTMRPPRPLHSGGSSMSISRLRQHLPLVALAPGRQT